MTKAKRCASAVLGLVVGVIASYGAGRLVRMAGVGPPAAWAEEVGQGAVLTATVERVMVGDREAGIVKVNAVEVVAINSPAGGLTGYERAIVLAKRLNDVFAGSVVPDDFRADVVQGMNVVLYKDQVLVTADQAEAELVGVQRAELAEQWAAAIRMAVRQALGLPQPGGTEQAQPPAEAAGQQPTEASQQQSPEEGQQPPATGQEQPTEAGQEQPTEAAGEQPAGGAGQTAPAEATVKEEWTPAEPYDEKDVFVLSVGEGKRLGVARVKGPRSRVNQVKAVALLETHYKNALEVEIYVPISTSVPGKSIARVQGVGVVGVAMYQISGKS
ncbi:MAG: hypothetical protein N2512_11630 [Armatimonadetes bacterium]|nr:hypothetical protein [Armatimonadota bacterium]